MIPLARYIAASCLNAQRWVAPCLVFLLGVVATYASGGRALVTLGEGATWLFPVTAWLTVTTLNDQDPSEAGITITAAGGPRQARDAKLMVAGGVGLLLTCVSLAAAYLDNLTTFTPGDLAAGVVSHLITVTAGLAFGTICARPLIARNGWAVLTVMTVTIVDLVIPFAPPVRTVLSALNATDPARLWAELAACAAETAVLAATLVTISGRLARSRT